MIQKNSKMAIALVGATVATLVAIYAYLQFMVSDASQNIENIQAELTRATARVMPQSEQLRSRVSTMRSISAAATRVDKLLQISDELTDTTSNAMQSHILRCASINKLAVRNYVPRVASFTVDKMVYSGAAVSFTIHGDYKPMLNFIAELEDTLPLCKLQKVTISPDAIAGGKLRMTLDIFMLTSGKGKTNK